MKISFFTSSLLLCFCNIILPANDQILISVDYTQRNKDNTTLFVRVDPTIQNLQLSIISLAEQLKRNINIPRKTRGNHICIHVLQEGYIYLIPSLHTNCMHATIKHEQGSPSARIIIPQATSYNKRKANKNR